jgi:hypothetical protein
VRPVRELLVEGHQFRVTFLEPEGVRLLVREPPHGQGATASLWSRRSGNGSWIERSGTRSRVAAGAILEVAVRLDDLGSNSSTLAFFVAVTDGTGDELERHPAHRPTGVPIPDAWFEAKNWTA